MQLWSHNEQSQVTQAQVEPTWQKASLRNELLRDIRSCCDMVCHQAYDHLRNHFLLGPLTSGLCYGISTSSNQDGHLHGIATRDSNQAWEFQGSCFEASKEYLRPETGWACVELIPCGQTHVHRIHNITNRWLHFLLRWHQFMVYVDDGILLGSNDSQLQEVIREI